MRTEVELPADPNRRKFVKMAAGAIVGLAAGFVALELDPLGLLDEPIPPNFFSNKTDEGVMGDENSMILSPKKAWQEFPQGIEEDQESHMVKMLFPFQPSENGKIKYTVNTTTTWQETNIRQPTLTLPKNTKFIAPFDARFFPFRNTEGQNHVDGIALIRYFPNRDITRGTTYILYILGKFNLEPVLQKLEISNNMDKWEELPGLGKGMLLVTTGGQTSVRMYAEAFPGKDIGMHEEAGKVVYNARPRLSGVEFVTALVGGVEKLIVIGNA